MVFFTGKDGVVAASVCSRHMAADRVGSSNYGPCCLRSAEQERSGRAAFWRLHAGDSAVDGGLCVGIVGSGSAHHTLLGEGTEHMLQYQPRYMADHGLLFYRARTPGQ